MIRKLILSVVVGVAVGLLCVLIGAIVAAFGLKDVQTFLDRYAALIALLAAVYYFFAG